MSEKLIGHALKELEVKRDEITIATKIPGEILRSKMVLRLLDGVFNDYKQTILI